MIHDLDPNHPTHHRHRRPRPGRGEARSPPGAGPGLSEPAALRAVWPPCRAPCAARRHAVSHHGVGTDRPLGSGAHALGSAHRAGQRREGPPPHRRLSAVIEPHLDQGFGAYVFLWGQKAGAHANLVQPFHAHREATAAVDAMQHLWTGRWPDNRAPTLHSLRLDGRTADSHVTLVERRRYTAVASVADPDGDAVAYQWNIKPESTSTAVGGDPEAPIDDRAGLIDDPSRARIELLAPFSAGRVPVVRVRLRRARPCGTCQHIPFLVRARWRIAGRSSQGTATAPRRGST